MNVSIDIECGRVLIKGTELLNGWQIVGNVVLPPQVCSAPAMDCLFGVDRAGVTVACGDGCDWGKVRGCGVISPVGPACDLLFGIETAEKAAAEGDVDKTRRIARNV